MAINDYLTGITNATAGQTTDVSNAAKDLSNLQAGAGSLSSKLKEALNTKLNNNSDIINQQATTQQNYFNAPAMAREKYQDVWDPFKKASLVQQERSMALKPYDVLSGILENRMGNVTDIVNAGVQGWQGLVDAAGTKAELAKTSLATRLQAYLAATGQQEAADQLGYQIAQSKEASRQFGVSSAQEATKIKNQESQFAQSLALDTLKAKKSGSGDGNLGGIDWNAIMGLGGGTETNISNLQEPPRMNPTIARAGLKAEYPVGSGVIWELEADGTWK